MTVKELISELEKLDSDLHVFVRGYEGGVDYAMIRQSCQYALNYNDESYYGDHEEIYNGDIDGYAGYEIVKGIQL